MNIGELDNPEWWAWNVGPGKRWENAEALRAEMCMAMATFGPTVGYTGGNIVDEIDYVSQRIEKAKKRRKGAK